MTAPDSEAGNRIRRVIHQPIFRYSVNTSAHPFCQRGRRFDCENAFEVDAGDGNVFVFMGRARALPEYPVSGQPCPEWVATQVQSHTDFSYLTSTASKINDEEQQVLINYLSIGYRISVFAHRLFVFHARE